MSETECSPLARLVLFMVCLSVAGTCVAGVHYFAIDLPEQNYLQAPANTMMTCSMSCELQFESCKSLCESDDRYCQRTCEGQYDDCKATC